MTDREMLELAAKAAGYIVVGLADEMVAQPGNKAGGLVIRNEHGGDSLWHPRNDDGDAFRLAVMLQLHVINDGFVCICRTELRRNIGVIESLSNNPDAATRLAITRAAAEIGRNLVALVPTSELPEDNYYKTQEEAHEIGRNMK